ncbi:MAG: hypothetical protein GXX96_05045 [Planctomycetaceae bacterium]|nr:hypothetical protein [Planctomycetaceae bacterium]
MMPPEIEIYRDGLLGALRERGFPVKVVQADELSYELDGTNAYGVRNNSSIYIQPAGGDDGDWNNPVVIVLGPVSRELGYVSDPAIVDKICDILEKCRGKSDADVVLPQPDVEP